MKQKPSTHLLLRVVKTCAAIFTLLLAAACYGQEQNYKLSKPLDIKQKGWSRVLCMKNGNTLLFHFETTSFISVKVFDSSRRETASRNDNYRVLDYFGYEQPEIMGLYEINGEAVIFIDQEKMTKHRLVRLRYNGTTGKLVQETLIAESEGANKRIHYYLMKNKDEDNYAVFFYTDVRHPVKYNSMYVVYFNGRHEATKEIHLQLERKKYDYVNMVGAQAQPNGVLITIGLDKTLQNARPDHNTPIVEGGAIYSHYLSYYFIPKDSSVPKRRMVDVTEYVYPYYSFFTYNPFAKAINSLLFSFHQYNFSFGANRVLGSVKSNHFFKIDPGDMSVSFNRIKDSIASYLIKSETDSANFLDGIPINMYTNENGLSTLVSVSKTRYEEPYTRVYQYDYENSSEYVGVTQFDDDGKEIWGTAFPLFQYYKRSRGYDSQFIHIRNWYRNNNLYIVFNDYDINLHNTLKKPGGGIYDYDVANTFCYSVNNKREVTKQYVFGQPRDNEYISSFVSSADFDEKRGVYAALVQYNDNGKKTLHMGWSKLE